MTGKGAGHRESAAALKRALREEVQRHLAGVSPAQAAYAGAEVAETALGLPEVAAADSVLCCLSFGSEIDTWGLVRQLLLREKVIYVPRADPGDRTLHLHQFPCDLETLSFGLRQPPRSVSGLAAAAVDHTVDVALVLGLGFDTRGYRLGFGAGYFDRFLAGRPFPAIGLAYQRQLFDELPIEPHDVPMAAVITETGTVRPER